MFTKVCGSVYLQWSIFILLLTVLSAPVFATSVDDDVQTAYELRMKGKADEAHAMLQRILVSDPGNAPALFELARTECHMFLGKPENTSSSLQRIAGLIDSAIRIEPDNAIFLQFRGNIALLQAYDAAHNNSDQTDAAFNAVADFYRQTLRIHRGYRIAMLYLVELDARNGNQSPEQTAEAEELCQQLEMQDAVVGAKARAMMLGENADRVQYWTAVIKDHPKSALAQIELGRTYLFNGKQKEATAAFETALTLDPSQSFLLLDMGRMIGMSAMQQQKPEKEKMLNDAVGYLQRYLSTKPIGPLEAFAYGLLTRLEGMRGNKEKSKDYERKASELDPYYSKAFGVPSIELFTPLNEETQVHRYQFSPM